MNSGTKTVLITGGASGIGFCTAGEFARAGYRVILTDIDEQRLAGAAQLLETPGCPVHTYRVDVTDREQVRELAESVQREFGPLDVLINNAGIGHHGELADTGLETWDRLIRVNLLGPLNHIYAFLPAMLKSGSGQIVNISSGQAFFRLPTWGAYASVKVALGALSEIMHYELRKHGISVTTVYPFMVNTPFYRDVRTDTLAGRLSMLLLPLYSMSPERVGRIIFKATQRHARVEMVSVLNTLALYGRMVPGVSEIMSVASDRLLSSRRKAA